MLKKQNGSALVISLIILLVMTIVGIQGMQSSTLEEKMSGNFRDRALAFEAAEAALKAAERQLDDLDKAPDATADGTGNDFSVWEFGKPELTKNSQWDEAGAVSLNDSSYNSETKYIIEQRTLLSESTGFKSVEIGAITKSKFNSIVFSYRITARGVGSSPNSTVLLQTNFEKSFAN